MTHRQFSRNASSSRAIPIEKMIDAVAANPATPSRFGLNQKGMQDGGEMTVFGLRAAEGWWKQCAADAVLKARSVLNHQEVPHKQIVNRVLEPYGHITVCVSATEWANFFTLRDHPDADPTMQALAKAMYAAYKDSTPRSLNPGEWHLPYIDDFDRDAISEQMFKSLNMEDVYTTDQVVQANVNLACKISAARCARVSYLTHDKKRPTIQEDVDLFARLMVQSPLHASPTEHQATPDTASEKFAGMSPEWDHPELHGNFIGWQQFRKTFVGESVASNRRKPKFVTGRHYR